MGALVAAAHGPVDASGRERTAALVTGNDALAGFPADWLTARLERFCDTFDHDAARGRAEALAAVARLAKRPEQARAAVIIGLAVGHADGEFDAAERAAVADACRAAGLAPSDFGL